MPSYPASLPQSAESTEEWSDPLLISYSRAGSVKARRLQGAKKRVFTIRHKNLTATQVASLETFYNANRSSAFDFAWNDSPATTYSVIFADDRGLQLSRVAGNYYDVSVKMAEV